MIDSRIIDASKGNSAPAWLETRSARPWAGTFMTPSGSISLSHILRLVRRPALPIPHPLFGPALERLGKRLGAGPLYGDGVRLLRFGRGVDNRRLRTELGYEPRFDAEGAIRDFAAKSAGRRVGPVLHPGDLAGRLSEALR